MISIRVSTGALRQLYATSKKLREAGASLEDRRALLTEIRDEVSDIWARDFMSQGRGEWAETSMFQQERRVEEGYSPTPTLLRSGATFSWFDAQNRSGNVNAASIHWNSQNADGAYTVSHHTGYTLGESAVPARTLWRLEAEEEDMIQAKIEMWLDAKMANVF